LQRFDVQPGFFMSALYLEALRGNAASLSVLMAGAWVVQQPAGNSGRVDGVWPFSPGLVGAGSALWPVGGAPSNARQRRYRDRQLRIGRLFLPPA
jgi:steroid 5-alpha reductase family enzyme